MEMVTGWTGREACALQAALRLSNVAFAGKLGIGLSTVKDWHDRPSLRPRPETQRILDTTLAQASAAERERFAALLGQPARTGNASVGEEAAIVGTDYRPDPRSVSIGVNVGVVSTGDGAMIDARTIHLPGEAVRAPAGVAAARGLHNLPAPSSAVFVDRQEDLAQLDAVMADGSSAVPPVVHGLGGTGKSTLALHYAHRNRDRYNPVWWILADSSVSITSGLAELAARLDPYQGLTAKNNAEAAAWAVSWLQTHTGWLLVFDDAASPRGIESVLGTLAGGRHLITSRRATGWHRVGNLMPLAPLPPAAALEMLMRIINSDPDDPNRGLLESIAAELGYLPLALEQAAAYIQYTAIEPAAYLDRLRRFPARMFAVSAPAEEANESANQRTVARIWQLTMQATEDEEPLAGEVLRTFAWFSPDPIPRDLTYALHDDPITVDDALALLATYSMITLTPQSVTIHRLVQAIARIPDPADPHRTPEAISSARARAAEILRDALPENALFNVPSWPRWRELIPHVLALADLTPPDEDTPDIAGILLAASGYLQGDGFYDEAVTLARRAVDAYRRLQGPDALDTLAARSFLASAYRAAGDLATAAPLHQLNLTDTERALGADHPQTLVARANLAYLYALQHRENDALELHERNLTDYQRVQGPDHPHTLNARANLASAHRAVGHLDRAIELHERSVADYARVFGPDHSETITARSNLAYAYQLASDLDRAIRLHRQVLADRERLYGPAHHYTELARQLLTNAEDQATEYRPADNPSN